MLTPEELEELVSELASRPGHEKVRALIHRLLVGGLDVDSRDIRFEQRVPEVRGRIDALLGRTVVEFKSDLRRERRDAQEGLTRYLSDREAQTGERYVGIATDGAQFIAFFLRAGELVEVGQYRPDTAMPRELLVWLQGAVAVGANLPPEPDIITGEFGRESLAAMRALQDLREVWHRVGGTPQARLKHELWGRLLSLAYGEAVGSEELFLQHTYLVVVAKAMAWAAMIDRAPADAAALLHGASFADYGITGQSEPDFFDWVLDAEDGRTLVMRVFSQVSRFALEDIRADILKSLYESLIDPETRHDLGEYYTPDWLAARIVSVALESPLEQRVMDPACGSGAFLFHAVRAVLAEARSLAMPPSQAVQRATEKVAGIDVHPVAVIFARVTYLLALLPALREGHPGDVVLPVYLGDSLQWNRVRRGEGGDQRELLEEADNLEIYVPAVELRGGDLHTLPATSLVFPASIASNAQLFDLVLATMIELGAREEPLNAFEAWLDRETALSPSERSVLEETYGTMSSLQNEGRNHIWGYVARNLARPVWLSSEAQKADVVIGNPPWVAYRHMSSDFKSRFRAECREARLWVGGKVATQQDLSGYFYLRAALLYMRRSGRIALVMPYAAMSRQAYSEFRGGEVVRHRAVELRLRFTLAWTFGAEVQPLFPVPSCVLFARVHESRSAAALPERVSAFSGDLPRRNATEVEADAALLERDAPWPTQAAAVAASSYHSAFRQGATLVPRRLVLVEEVPATGRLPRNPAAPLVRGRVGSQDKRPWKLLEPPEGTVECGFLRPVLLGESIVPFRVMRPLQGVIPWDPDRSDLMDAETAVGRGHLRLGQWLQETERIWDRHKQSDLSLISQFDYFGKLTAQFPVRALRVVYTQSGTRLAASVVRDQSAIVEHKLYWAPAESAGEAWYLCGVLNSEVLRARVERYQSQGQWGARDFDKYVFNLPIPRFDPNNGHHRVLAHAARTAEEIAHQVPPVDGEYFTVTRRRVREALSVHGIAARLEGIVGRLLDAGGA